MLRWQNQSSSSMTISPTPPTRLLTTGLPAAMACATIVGAVSWRENNTTARASPGVVSCLAPWPGRPPRAARRARTARLG